jgi:hypothetical protein
MNTPEVIGRQIAERAICYANDLTSIFIEGVVAGIAESPWPFDPKPTP